MEAVIQEGESFKLISDESYCDDVYDQVKQIKRKIEDFRKYRNDDQSVLKNIIFIGKTGAGKSTLVNYLAGNELEATEDEYEEDLYTIEAQNCLEGIKIGTETSSCTKIPTRWVSDENIAYWDCPGFGDTEGPVQDIANAYYINELFNKSKEALVALVVNSSTIKSERHDNFLNLTEYIDKLGLTDFLESVSLVVTSSKIIKEKVVQYFSNKVLPAVSKENNQSLKKFVQHFIQNSDQVTVFPQPTKPGIITTENANVIQQVLEGVTPLSDASIKPSISDGTIKAIFNWAKVINKSIKHIIESKISESCCAILKTCKLQNEYSNLKVRLTSIINKCDMMQKSQNKDELMNTYKEFQNMLQIIKFEDDFKLKENIDLLEFFKIYNSDVELDLSNFGFASKASELCSYLKGLPVDSSIENGVLVIKQHILGMSDVIKEYYANQDKKIHSIDILCYSFYFDQDVVFPSINLSIQTQYIHIQGDRKVNLKGQDGEEIVPSKAENGFESGENGHDGQPGSPGKPGGNFYLRFKQKSESGKLQIDVSGGDGGNGQNGGDGQKGEDGQDGDYNMVYKRKEECLVSRTKRKFKDRSGKGKFIHAIKTIGTFNGQFYEIYRSCGTDGQRGGKGGCPGIGGKGANPGKISINNHSQISFKTSIKRTHGKCGISGSHGKTGQNGNPGKDWYGEYIDEMVCASFRKKIKEEDKKSDHENNDDENDEEKELIDEEDKEEPNNEEEEKIDHNKNKNHNTKRAKLDGEDAIQAVGNAAAPAASGAVSCLVGAAEIIGNLSIFAAKTSFSAANVALGLGGGLAIQGGISAISAHASSGWKVKPTMCDREDEEQAVRLEDEILQLEDEVNQCNEEGLVHPEEGVDYQPDLAEFENYIAEFREDMGKIVGKKEAKEWLG